MRMTMSAALVLFGLFGLTEAALAQSTGAPAGRDPATAPGGTEGIAGPRNEREAIRNGDAIPAPRGVGEPSALPPDTLTLDRQSPAPRP